MFYNSYRATKSALQRSQNTSSPKNYLLNQQNRLKLKDLLMAKFIQKYNIKDPDEYLDLVLTQFIRKERLTDRDLKRLSLKIRKLSKDFSNRNILKSDLENLSQKPLKTEINNLTKINTDRNKNNTLNKFINNNNFTGNDNNINEIKNKNEQNQIKNLKTDFPSLTTYSTMTSKTEANLKKRDYSSNVNHKNIICFKSPEEELAILEKELEEEELLEKKNKYKRIDFSPQGDEWTAIVNYNKNLYKRQVLEEKIKDREIKKRTKECLDIQIKEKLKRELNEKNEEKEFERKVEEFNRNLDDIDKKKEQKIIEQIKRLKKDRDEILTNETLRKKIEKFKEKKFDKILVKKYKEQIEQEKQAELARKKKGKEDLMKAKKFIEEKQKSIKERIEKEKEDDKRLDKFKSLLEQRKENERNYYYQKIKSLGNKYIIPNSQKVLEKIEKEKKEEDEKIQYYYEEKNRKEFEKERKAKLKRFNDKIEIKKFLDMQIAEKKKEKNFLKLLDQEQAKIWKIDLKKRNDEMELEKEHIKRMNRKNFEFILKQIEQKKRSKSRKNIMTESEYAINRSLLEKANEDYLKSAEK